MDTAPTRCFSQRGFTLIESMIVLAIVGILAALALPRYEEFRLRGERQQLVLTINRAMQRSEAYRLATARWPDSLAALGLADQVAGHYVMQWQGSDNGPTISAQSQEDARCTLWQLTLDGTLTVLSNDGSDQSARCAGQAY
ncbi:type II secretion system protein [Gammaproteobacteria bacterium]|nr:type II secretion system protein [Gammaproteobacteria bacterium]